MKFNQISSTCLMLIILSFHQTTFVNCTDDSAAIDPVIDTLQIISNQDNDADLPPLISELNKKLTVCEELKQLNDEKIQEFCKSTEYSVYMKCVEYNRKKFQEQKRRMKRQASDCDLDDCDQDDICDRNVCQNSCRTCTNNCDQCESCSRCASQSCCHRHCRRQCTTTRCRHACVNNCVNKPQPPPTDTRSVTNTHTDTRTDTHTSNTTVLNSYNLTTAIKFTNYINTSNVVDIPININTTNVNNITLTEQVSKQEEVNPLCCFITTPTECVNITVEPYVQCIHRRYKVCGPQCFQQPAPPPQPPVVIRVPYGIPQPYTVVQTVRVPQPIPVDRTVLVRQPFPIPQPVMYPVRINVPQPVPVPQPYPVRVPVVQPVPIVQPVPQPIIQQPIVYQPPRPSCPLCGGGGCPQQVSGVSACPPPVYGTNFGYYGGIGNYPISWGSGSLPLYGGTGYQVLYSTMNASNPGILPPQPVLVQQPYPVQPLLAPPVSQISTGILGSDSTVTSTTANQNVLNTAGAAYTLPAAGQFGGYTYGNQLGGYVDNAQLAGYTGGAQIAGYTEGAQLAGYTGGAQLGGYTGGAQFGGYTGGAQFGGYPGAVQYSTVAGAVPQYTTYVTGNQTVPITTLPGALTPDQSNIAGYQYSGVANANVYPGTGTYSAVGGPVSTYNLTSTDTSSNTARPYGLHQFFN